MHSFGSTISWLVRADARNGGFPVPAVMLERGGFDIERQLRQSTANPRIRCPHCRWQPRKSSIWTCLAIGHPEYLAKGCGHSWNTFDTRGLCPGCNHQWLFTSCLACGQWALHEDWYEDVAGEGPPRPGL